MFSIEFKNFCGKAYDGITNLSNQGDFVTDIFKAAGSNYIFNTTGYSKSNYPTKLFNGGKPLSGKIRKSFRDPIDKKGVADYLEKHISNGLIQTVMDNFAIPGNAEINLTALSWALAEQLQIIIHQPDSDSDVVSSEYQRYANEPIDTLGSSFQPLYAGDAYWNQSDRNSTYTIDFYEKITHKWVIKNTGKVCWTNRKLVCSNYKQVPPRTDTDSIVIPETKPGETATLAVIFDARGIEGQFVSTWAMINGSGDDCFPNSSYSFSVTINVINKAFNSYGGNRQ